MKLVLHQTLGTLTVVVTGQFTKDDTILIPCLNYRRYKGRKRDKRQYSTETILTRMYGIAMFLIVDISTKLRTVPHNYTTFRPIYKKQMTTVFLSNL